MVAPWEVQESILATSNRGGLPGDYRSIRPDNFAQSPTGAHSRDPVLAGAFRL